MNLIKSAIISTFLLVSTFFQGFSQECIPDKPQSFILDKLGILKPEEVEQLNTKLNSFANKTSTQIAVVIVDDICGMDKAMYATELGQQWGVGQEGKDNGIVILIKPTGGKGQRQTYIAVGYGLEGVIPDAIAKRIVENELIPYFKVNNFSAGINAGVDVIIKLTEGEFTADEYAKKGAVPALLIFIVFGVIILVVIISRFSAARSYASNNNVSLWLALLFLMSSSNRHSGSYNSFNSGGGGFGGFGGGSFGGGGVGGSW